MTDHTLILSTLKRWVNYLVSIFSGLFHKLSVFSIFISTLHHSSCPIWQSEQIMKVMIWLGRYGIEFIVDNDIPWIIVTCSNHFNLQGNTFIFFKLSLWFKNDPLIIHAVLCWPTGEEWKVIRAWSTMGYIWYIILCVLVNVYIKMVDEGLICKEK